MRLHFIISVWLAGSALSLLRADAPEHRYLTNDSLTERLKEVAATYAGSVRLRSIATSLNNQPVWLLELGHGTDEERATRPAILLAAGIEGHDLAGTSTALAWATDLAGAADDDSDDLLDSTTIYILPRINPDAAAAFFENPKQERSTTFRPSDDDHDGMIDEDGPEDLNGDGLITWMRVEDHEGEYILDPSDPRLLMKADPIKGEVGAWRYLVEGTDNDGDEEWNEDAPGGVNLNRNFAYNYKFFAPATGQHPMSEATTRAIADFIVDHPNIAIVFTFGDADNLIQPPEGKEERTRRPPTSLQKDDLPYYRELGKSWREALGLKKELKSSSEPGTFSDWMYFHRGRLSLAARSWSPALQVELAKAASAKSAGKKSDETENEKADSDKAEAEKPKPTSDAQSQSKSGVSPKPATDNRNEEERAFLKWIDEHAPEAFVPWKQFDHPDFPGKKVEIGGFAPHARSCPPENLLPDLIEKQLTFLNDLISKLPRVKVRKAEARHLGNSVYELIVEVENTGYLPTSLAQGQLTREVLPTRITLQLPNEALLSGALRTTFEQIEGSGGSREVRYIIHGKGRDSVRVEVVSALGGTAQAGVVLTD